MVLEKVEGHAVAAPTLLGKPRILVRVQLPYHMPSSMGVGILLLSSGVSLSEYYEDIIYGS
jgi:hypothetical protein